LFDVDSAFQHKKLINTNYNNYSNTITTIKDSVYGAVMMTVKVNAGVDSVHLITQLTWIVSVSVTAITTPAMYY